MPSVKDAAYWRAYRATVKSAGLVALAPVPPERQYVHPAPFHSNFQYLPGDHAVGDMTQAGRDHVLARMAKVPAK
jgi:hypothetical protein